MSMTAAAPSRLKLLAEDADDLAVISAALQDAVAKVGSSGGQGVPALYFELRRNGQPVDPSSWLQRR